MSDTQIRAVLSARDNMTAVFNRASQAVGQLKSGVGQTIKTGAAFAVGMKAVSAGMTVVGSSIGTAVSRFDTLNNFPKVMQNLGIGTKSSEKAIQKLSKGIDGLPTTLDSAASGVQAFVSANGNINKSTKYFLAMNDAIVAGGQSSQVQQSAIEQLSQSYAKGKMDMEEWRALQTAMPAQLKQVATAMDMTTTQLGEGLRNGSVSMDDFMNTMVQLDKKGVGGLASFSKQAQGAVGGIATSVANMKTKVAKGLADMLGTIDDSLTNNKLPTIAGIIQKGTGAIGKAFARVNKFIEGVDWASVIASARPYWDGFKSAVLGAGHALLAVAGFLLDNSEAVSKLIKPLIAVGIAWKTIKIVNSITGPVKTITASFSKLAGGVLTRLAPQLVATAGAEAAAGEGAKASAGSVLKLGVAVLAVGAGLALACAGLALLAQSAIALASAGGGAVAVMGGLILVVAGLAVGASVLGAALTAGAVGFIAFGAAVLMVAAGMYIMAKAVKVAAPALSTLIRTAGTVVIAILQQMTASFMVAGAVIVSVLNAVAVTASTVLTSIAQLFASFGAAVNTILTGVATVITSIGTSISAVLNSVAGIFDSIGNAALNAGRGVLYVAQGIRTLVNMKLSDLVATLGATASGLKKIAGSAGGVSRAASSFGTLAKSAALSKASLASLPSAFRSVSGAATSAGKSAGTGFANGVKSGMNSAKSTATSGARSVVNALKSAESGAKSAGSMISAGFASGMRSALGEARAAGEELAAIAEKAVRDKAKIKSPSRVAMELGNYFGEGYAIGIEKMKGMVKRASENMMTIPAGYNGRYAVAGASLSGDASYGASFKVEVPLEIDGKQFAKATATYNQNEISKLETRNSRRHGRL